MWSIATRTNLPKELCRSLGSPVELTSRRTADEIPEITDDDGTRVRVICGSFWGKSGPVDGIAANPRYLDVSVPPGQRKVLPVEMSDNAFAKKC